MYKIRTDPGIVTHSSFEPNLYAHCHVLSSRVANRCASNNDSLCVEMSSCSNSFQISFFRQRDTAETCVPKSAAISVSVFPLKDISHAVKIVLVFERRILKFLAQMCKKLVFQPFTQLILHYLTLLVKLKLQKNAVFCEKTHNSSKKVRNSSKTCKMGYWLSAVRSVFLRKTFQRSVTRGVETLKSLFN